jgi:DNA-directed RNA polymerase specialized sigma24 family protein
MIPRTTDARSDRAALIYRHYERLYRLAMLVAGNAATAATLVQSAYQQLPTEIDPASDTETLLIRALLDQRLLRKTRWALTPPALTHTTLDRRQAAALLGALAAFPPPARLAIGLAYINGSTPAEIDELLGPARGELAADLLARFRIAATRALGLAPTSEDDLTLARLDRLAAGQLAEDEALALRRDLIGQPALRDLRDRVLAVHELLPHAIPALFAAPPPPALVDQLAELAQNSRPVPAGPASSRRAPVLLAIGVLALSAAIILIPSLLAQARLPTVARNLTVAEMLDRAVHRFDRAPLEQGVVHEQYRVEHDNQANYLIERWYDYATPNRLALSVSQEGRDGPPLLQVGTDGQSLVQLRYGRNGGFGEQPADIKVSAGEAQKLVPLLRGMSQSASFARSNARPVDPAALFLAQARASNPSYLGQTTLLGRSAFLLTYQADQPPAGSQPARVLLTIDAQTYALLDVAVVALGEAESTARHPLRAVQFEVLTEAPDSRFILLSGPRVSQQTGLASVRFPYIDARMLVSIDAAAEQTPDQLLAPLVLPDAGMRGLAVRNNRPATSGDVILIYEGEFQNVIVLPNFDQRANQNLGDEQVAGAFRYRLISGASSEGGLAAMVYRPEESAKPLGLILNDQFATPAERETTLRSLIESLTPIDDQTLPLLRRNFQPPSPAAGGT